MRADRLRPPRGTEILVIKLFFTSLRRHFAADCSLVVATRIATQVAT
jgi:hypothetical protein